MLPVVWALLAGLAAITIETLATRVDSYRAAWWVFVPLSLVVNYAIVRLVQSSTSLLAALVVFSCVTLGARVLVTLGLKQPVGLGTWIAVGFLTCAVIARQLWPDPLQ